jgi:hypothetical protein
MLEIGSGSRDQCEGVGGKVEDYFEGTSALRLDRGDFLDRPSRRVPERVGAVFGGGKSGGSREAVCSCPEKINGAGNT